MPAEQTSPVESVSPLRGVYRFRENASGRPLWYAVLPSGEMTELEIALGDETDAEVVARLCRLAYGDDLPDGHSLTLLDGVADTATQSDSPHVRPTLTVIRGGWKPGQRETWNPNEACPLHAN